jgi:hypothetical protein
MNKAEIEKYKMLISTMPEDKAEKAIKMLKNRKNTKDDILQFITENADVYIVKDPDEIKDKNLTGYGAVMFDCDVKGVADFSNCPKKMIFDGNVNFCGMDIEEFPDLSEAVVVYNFECGLGGKLTSFKGAPKYVGMSFYCRGCDNLTSLDGAPKYVGGRFDCLHCRYLTSLEGLPKEVGSIHLPKHFIQQDGQYYNLFNLPKDKEFVIDGDLNLGSMHYRELPDLSNVIVKGDFDCSCNDITSLKGAPKYVGGKFGCSMCHNLISLEGAPEKHDGIFDCSNCENLTSLKGAPKEVGGKFDCDCCDNLISLEGAPEKVGGDFDCIYCENLTSADGLPKEIGGEIRCDDQMRPIFDKELKRRKNISEASILFMKKFGNGGM